MAAMSSSFIIKTYTKDVPNDWQSFVDSSDLYNIFQTRQWAKAMQKAGLGILLTLARDEKDHVKGGILGIYGRYSFFGLKTIPMVQVWGGPILYDTNDKHLVEVLLRAFEKEAKKLGVISSYIRSFVPLDDILVDRLNYTMEFSSLPCTVIIDLTRSIEEIWKQLQERGRRSIRKALKQGVSVEEGKTIEDLLIYYEISKSTRKRLKTPLVPLRLMMVLWKTFSQENNTKLFLAKHRGKPIAGVIIVRWRDKIWGWHGASLAKYWPLNANLLIHWNIIEWGVKNHLKTYDLMGIPCKKDSSHPKYGLYLFKTQLGGNIVRHGEYAKNYFPLTYFLLSKIFRPIRSRLPKTEMREENLSTVT